MTAALAIEGATFTDTTDFAAFAREVLRGGGGVASRPDDSLPVDWMYRVYPRLRDAGSPYADRLSEGIAANLDAPEPFVRFQATIFFEEHPRAMGGERIEAIVAGDRRLFAGVRVPSDARVDLEWHLLRALGARAYAGQGGALDLARAEALRPGKAQPLVAHIVGADGDFAARNAEAIVRGSPDALGPLLYQLGKTRRDVAGVGERLARLGVVEPSRFAAAVEDNVSDPAARRRILAALPTGKD